MSNTRRTPRDRGQPPPVSVQAEASSSPPHADEVANAAPATPPPPQAAPGPAPPTPPTLAPRAPPSPPSSASAKPAPSGSGGRPAETGLPRDTGNVSQADLASVLQAIHAGNQLMLVQFNEARMMEFAAAREQAEQFQQALSDMFNRSQTSQDSLGNSFAQRTDLMQQNLSAVTTVLNETLTSIQTDQQSRANVQSPAMSKSHPTRPPPRPKHDFSQIPAVDSTVSDPMSMAVHWRNTLRQIKITVEAGAADLAYHYKSEAENLSISGPDARFATYADRTSFADAVFQLVRRIPIDWLGENVKSAWNPDAPNTASMINNFNVEFVHNAYAESVRILEEWVYACLQARVEPQSSKTRVQVYEHSVHAHLKNRPSAAGPKA